MVPQFLTERVMRERLVELGHQPEFGCELVGLEQDKDSVTVRLAGKAGEEVIRGRYLAGADGGRSFVRHALDIDFPGKTLGVRAVVADVLLAGVGRDAWHRFSEGSMERQLSLCPLAGTEMFQLQAPIPIEGDVDLSAEGLSKMVAERTGRDNIQIHSVSWASAFNMNARLADRYRAGRVFLAGDSAHIHPPTGGQGLNTSIQDSYNLGWKLAAVARGAPIHCSTATRKNAGRSQRACSALRIGCSMRRGGAICAVAARCINWISAIRIRRFRLRSPSAKTASSQATERRTHPF
jgi:2-polyprenyl-6-methoxyphenol hydroxylase-like FAD-dependent oxidoreductase